MRERSEKGGRSAASLKPCNHTTQRRARSVPKRHCRNLVSAPTTRLEALRKLPITTVGRAANSGRGTIVSRLCRPQALEFPIPYCHIHTQIFNQTAKTFRKKNMVLCTSAISLASREGHSDCKSWQLRKLTRPASCMQETDLTASG